jgi:hypothetical protein
MKKKDMPHFTEQERPEKVKDIYKALKAEHPEMPAEYKARIAAKFGKKGIQKQGPPYKAPLTKLGQILKLGDTKWKRLVRHGKLSLIKAQEMGLFKDILKKQTQKNVYVKHLHKKNDYLTKSAGGPGSGISSDNTMYIGLPLSEYVSVGTRKALLENMSFKEVVVPISKITKVAQEKFVPKKLNEMMENKREVLLKPIDLLKINNEYHVVDGHHRFLVALKTGAKNIKARVYERRNDVNKRDQLIKKEELGKSASQFALKIKNKFKTKGRY